MFFLLMPTINRKKQNKYLLCFDIAFLMIKTAVILPYMMSFGTVIDIMNHNDNKKYRKKKN